MAENTPIEWADDTVNPWWGCAKVSPACTNCYAETMDRRGLVDGGGHWGPSSPRFIRIGKALAELDRIARKSDRQGRPRRVFIASMADVFEDRPDLVEPRKQLWDHLHHLGRRITPLLLTKRPDVMAAWAKKHGWPEGAWAGTTVEDQRRADERIPHLLQVPAEVRFLSCEPLLGPVDLFGVDTVASQSLGPQSLLWPADLIDWVIAGGESGPRARPCHPTWVRSLRDQCNEADVAFHLKQWGSWAPWDDDNWSLPAGIDDVVARNNVRHIDGVDFLSVGKRQAGRQLDGRTWDQVPEVSP